MKIKIIRGTNQIGGSITEITSKKGTKILIDFGKELENEQLSIPKINWREYKAVFITHNHEDHIGLLNYIPKYIPVYIEELSFEIFKIFLDFTQNDKITRQVNTFKIGDKIIINNDIKITSFITDHSSFNSLMYLVECDNKLILHTGDFRMNGYKAKLVEKMINKIKKVDVIIMEGTTLSRENKKNILEKELVNDIYQKTKDYDNVLILQSSTNIDRVVTMYKSMQKYNKIFVEDLFTATITTILANKGYSIPNPNTFKDVYSFIPLNRSEYNKKTKSAFYYKYVTVMKKDGHIEMTKNKFCLLVKISMFKDIELYYKKGYLKRTCLIYSMWEGYKEKDSINNFLNKIKNLGIDIITCHTSGHSDEIARETILNNIEYKYLIPIHTEEKNKFKKYKNTYILDDEEEFEII